MIPTRFSVFESFYKAKWNESISSPKYSYWLRKVWNQRSSIGVNSMANCFLLNRRENPVCVALNGSRPFKRFNSHYYITVYYFYLSKTKKVGCINRMWSLIDLLKYILPPVMLIKCVLII